MAKEKKETRKHIFKHKTRLELVANRLISERPTEAIAYNSLKDIYDLGHSDGYIDRTEDSAYFKAKREWHRKNSFNMVLDHIEDLRMSTEGKPKRPRINQSKK